MARLLIVGSLMAVYLALAATVISRHPGAAVLNHFAYIPIVLSAMWWGRRAVWIGLVPGAAIALFHVLGITSAPAWSDAVRAFFFVGVSLTVAWLSERVSAGHKALRLSEENLRILIENSLTGVLVYRDERLIFCNRRLEQMLLYQGDREAIIGRQIWDLLAPEDRVIVQKLASRRRQEPNASLHYEARLLRRDGTKLWADISSFIAQYGREPAVVMNIYDLTQLREAQEKRLELHLQNREQEEQLIHSTRLAELGEMAGTLAHEVNQPLTGIRNYAKNAIFMIESGAGGQGEVRANLERISEQVDRAARIITQLREQTQRTDREWTRLDVGVVVREAVEFLMPQMRVSNVDVHLSIQDPVPAVIGDRVRLGQVVLNLLTNARQAMESSQQRVLDVRVALEPDQKKPVTIAISDTGTGFDMADLDKLFKPFFTTKKRHGTGLGLSVAQTILKEHSGDLEASGNPGQGACFTIRLPAAATPLDHPSKAESLT